MLTLSMILAANAATGWVPVQGALVGADGAPLQGGHSVAIQLLDDPDEDGTPTAFYTESATVQFEGGLFFVALGGPAGLDLDLLARSGPMWLTVAVAGGPASAPVPLAHAPRAAWAERAGRADLATEAEHTPWSGLTGVPTGLNDGDNDTRYAPGAGLALSGTTFSVNQAALSPSWSNLVGVPSDLLDGDQGAAFTIGDGLTLTGGVLSVTGATGGALSVTGALNALGGVRPGDVAAGCTSAIHGTLRFSSGRLEVCVAGDTWATVYTPCTTGEQIFAYSGANVSFTVPAGCSAVVAKAWGAGGGGGNASLGGGGGYATARLTVTPSEVLTVQVGGGGGTDSVTSGGGGGYTGIFRGAVIQANALLIAGGGGGGGHASSVPHGGAGGGATAQNGVDPGGTSEPGLGGSQVAGGGGGAGTYAGEAGSALQGGRALTGGGGYTIAGGFPGGGHGRHFGGVMTNAGGGGGYFGGGSTGYNGNPSAGAGGGSGFVTGTATQNLTGSGQTPANSADTDRAGAGLGAAAAGSGANGRLIIRWGI